MKFCLKILNENVPDLWDRKKIVLYMYIPSTLDKIVAFLSEASFMHVVRIRSCRVTAAKEFKPDEIVLDLCETFDCIKSFQKN